MAIEKFTISSGNDLKSVIESLGWFDEVVFNTASLGSVECYVDSTKIADITCANANASASTTFHGSNSRYIRNSASFMPTVVYKTKNGLLMLRDADGATAYGGNSKYSSMIIGKTNNNKIACSLQGSSGTSYSALGTMWTLAENESSLYSEYCMQFRNGSYGVWSDSPQIVTCPIPTHPDSGTSYIVGAAAIVVGSSISTGIMEIDGKDYATNGFIALSD